MPLILEIMFLLRERDSEEAGERNESKRAGGDDQRRGTRKPSGLMFARVYLQISISRRDETFRIVRMYTDHPTFASFVINEEFRDHDMSNLAFRGSAVEEIV